MTSTQEIEVKKTRQDEELDELMEEHDLDEEEAQRLKDLMDEEALDAEEAVELLDEK